MLRSLVGSEMCIRDRPRGELEVLYRVGNGKPGKTHCSCEAKGSHRIDSPPRVVNTMQCGAPCSYPKFVHNAQWSVQPTVTQRFQTARFSLVSLRNSIAPWNSTSSIQLLLSTTEHLSIPGTKVHYLAALAKFLLQQTKSPMISATGSEQYKLPVP